MSKDRIQKLLDSKRLPRYTEKSITDPKRYLEEIRTVQQTGYATDDEEYISGVRAVASSINGEKNLMSAIWVVGFKMNMDNGKMAAIARETKHTAEAISLKVRNG